MSKQNKLQQLKLQLEAERQAHQQTQQQLQNMDVGFIAFIKSRIKKFLNCFKIKNLDLFKNYKITKLKIVLPSLCLLFVVGLVYFFAFAEPAEQLPQNQTFLNLAHSHINASTTAPTTYTSTSTHTSQADFEASGSGGFGYSTSSTPGSVVGNDDLGVYRSAPIDLGLKTKLANAVITKGGSARVFARSGSVASESPVEVKRTIRAELEAGSVQTNVMTDPNPTLVGENGSDEYAYNQISAQADPPTGSTGFGTHTNLGIGTSVSDQAYCPFLYRLSDGTYRLYYGYVNGTYIQLSYRTSANGLTGWSARTDLGIGTSVSDQAWSSFLYRLSDGTYRVYYTYSNGTYWQLSYRTSANGLTGWSARTDLGIGTSVSDQAWSPFLYRLSDGTYRVYYSYYNGTYPQLSYRTQNMVSASSVYESDTLELSVSAQGDKLSIQASVPTNTTLTYKIRSGETATPDGSWSSWTATTSVVSGLNIFNISTLTGKYWQVGFEGTSDGTATWTMGGFAVEPQASGYGQLVEIVNPTDIQSLSAERYLQYLAFGDTTWNVNDVSLTSKFTAIDLGKRYNIDTLSLTDTDDDLYRIHYSLQNENKNYRISLMIQKVLVERSAALKRFYFLTKIQIFKQLFH
ncbi:MAG: hypothetical protein ABIJ80_02025 [Patescibacteria group bacterium]